MGFFSSLFGKKKKTAKWVIDREDDQSEFLKSDEEMRAKPSKKSSEKSETIAQKTKSSEQKTAKTESKYSAEEKTAATVDVPKAKVKGDQKSSTDDEEKIDFEKTVAVKEGKETRNGKFDVRRAKDGRYFFCLYASNHAPIAYSQMYSTIGAAMNGIDSIIANSQKAGVEDTTLKKPTVHPFPKWEIYIDKAGEYRFRLYATNGLCICHSSHGYSTKSGCKGGMESIKRFSAEAKVDKSYLG